MVGPVLLTLTKGLGVRPSLNVGSSLELLLLLVVCLVLILGQQKKSYGDRFFVSDKKPSELNKIGVYSFLMERSVSLQSRASVMGLFHGVFRDPGSCLLTTLPSVGFSPCPLAKDGNVRPYSKQQADKMSQEEGKGRHLKSLFKVSRKLL